MSEPITLDMMRQHLTSAVVCDALDAAGFPHQSPRLQLRPLTVETVLVGRCKTTLWSNMFHSDPKPYELELLAVDGCKPDDVLIAAANGSMHSGIWGELLSTASKTRGAAACVTDGLVRDIRAIRKMKFPVFAGGIGPLDSKGRGMVAAIDVPVDVAGVHILPGDLVFGDADGIVVIPQKIETKVLTKALEKVLGEHKTLADLKRGHKLADVFARYGVL